MGFTRKMEGILFIMICHELIEIMFNHGTSKVTVMVNSIIDYNNQIESIG